MPKRPSKPRKKPRSRSPLDDLADALAPGAPPANVGGGEDQGGGEGGGSGGDGGGDGDGDGRENSARVAVAEPPAENAGPGTRARMGQVFSRLRAEGRWGEVGPVRDQMMRECRDKGMSKAEAQAWVYPELDRLYPPLPQPAGPAASGTEPVAPFHSNTVRGLADLPADWPDLPANASLAAEVGWCQANRLRVVDEQASGAVVVHLERAMAPAPSWAAIGWLETSVRSYAKFVDVVSRALKDEQDEQADLRRERMALEEIDAILAEMDDAPESDPDPPPSRVLRN